LNAPEYRLGQTSFPALDASASRDKGGRIHLSLVNLDPHRPARVALRIAGATTLKGVTGRLLTATVMNAVNTFDSPAAVKPVPFAGVSTQSGETTLSLPSKSVVVLEF
jgi:alpha-N-arabinofuranosidase